MNKIVSVITRCGECRDSFVLNVASERERAKRAPMAIIIGRSDICEKCADAYADKFKRFVPLVRLNAT